MITGTLTLQPQPGRRSAVLEILRTVQGLALDQPGCAAFHIYEDLEPAAAIVLVERWDTEAALERHVGSDAYRLLQRAISLSCNSPEFRFESVSTSEGMERVERARRRPPG